MKINLNFIFVLMATLIIALIFWNVYLLNNTKALKQEIFQLKENYQDLEAFNEIILYDRETARDSVRILEKMVEQ